VGSEGPTEEEDEEQSLKLAQGQPWSVSDFIWKN